VKSLFCVLITAGICVLVLIYQTAALPALPFVAINSPVLKWAYGGCTSYCQTGWYVSPAVANIDNDPQLEVIGGSYDLVALDGNDGSLQWRAASSNRIWPDIAVADLSGNGQLQIIVARSGGVVTAYNKSGGVEWTSNPFGANEVRGVAVDDLENDGSLEVIVSAFGTGATKQFSVLGSNGLVRAGWPARHDGDLGFGAGAYNENIAVADLNNDGYKEIIGATDTHYITALDRNGNQLTVNAIYSPRTVWSQVGIHVDQAADLVGFADCGVQHRPNFALSAPAIGDVDGDGSLEIVVVGNAYNCAIGQPEGDLYHLPWIFKLDRTRWSGSGFNWTVIPTPPSNSGPLSEDYNVIQNALPNAVLADLDGDGRKEILFPSYDGRLHAYWLDKTEHGNWPYKVPGTGYRFVSEPVIADLNNDGHAEVIFTSWPENGGDRNGQLHVLDYQGSSLFALNLPAPLGNDWNGGLAAPTIANIDADSDMELVINTVSSGLVAYDLPGTSNARILWGTGRGNFKRTGLAPPQTQLVRRRGQIISQ
jgi:hypothetical protein